MGAFDDLIAEFEKEDQAPQAPVQAGVSPNFPTSASIDDNRARPPAPSSSDFADLIQEFDKEDAVSVPSGLGNSVVPPGERPEGFIGDDYLKPIFGTNPLQDVYEMAAPALDPTSNRPLDERITDTAAFLASAPQQALRLPSIGTGVESLTGYSGLKESEDRFVENNPDLLRGLGALGEVAPGLTRGLGQGVPRQPTVDPRTAIPDAVTPPRLAESAGRMADDLAAFDRQGVRPLAPAMGGPTTRAVGKGLSDIWGIGKPMGDAIDDTLQGSRNAAQRVAGQMSDEVTAEQLGRTLQQGVDRFTQQGFRDIEPTAVSRLGIDPRAAVQPQQQMGQQQARRLAEAQGIRQQAGGGGDFITSRGVRQPVGGTRGETFTARRGIQDLSDSELAQIVGRDRAPARETSFRTRQEALYEVADRQLPRPLRINNSGNPQMMPATNLRQTWEGITNDIASSFTREQLQNPLINRLVNAQRSNFTLQDLQAIRREIGRDLGRLDETNATLDRSQLSSLYRAISTDLENAYRDAASRAWRQTRVSQNQADYVSPAQARQADAALKSFRRADRYTRASMERVDKVMKVLKARTPESAAQALVLAARSGTKGNMGLLRTVRGMLRPEEFSQFQSYVMRELGTPTAGAKGVTQEVGFSPATFSTNWNRLGRQAQAILFDGEHRQAINDIVRISERVGNFDVMGNPSRTATTLANLGLLGGVGYAFDPAAMGTIAAGAAAPFTASVILSRPTTARLMAGYMQARANGLNSAGAVTRARRILLRLRNEAARPGIEDDVSAAFLAGLDQEIESLDATAETN